MLLDNLGHQGLFNLQLLDAETKEVIQEIDITNQIMQFARNRYLRMLSGQTSGVSVNDLAIRYMAIGDGTTPVATSNTKLANERYRQQVTAKTLQADRVISMLSISPFVTSANFRIREIGVFCGSGASQSKDSGFLLARVLVDIDKNSNTILNITRQDIVTI